MRPACYYIAIVPHMRVGIKSSWDGRAGTGGGPIVVGGKSFLSCSSVLLVVLRGGGCVPAGAEPAASFCGHLLTIMYCYVDGHTVDKGRS